ncbi:MAG: FG-GAP-like repeat-containing protein [Candidatus Eremiobacterota bacterium]
MRALASALVVLGLLLTGCSGNQLLDQAAGQDFVLRPQDPTLAVGETVQMTAHFVFNFTQLGDPVQGVPSPMAGENGLTFSIDHPAIATVTPEGLVQGVAPGSTVVRVRFLDFHLNPIFPVVYEAQTTVTVTGDALLSLTVTPADGTIQVGAMQPFTATGTFADGSTRDLTASVTWSSSNPAAATIDGTGLSRGVAPGTTTIAATLGSLTGSTHLTVTAASLVALTVTPANPTARACGVTQQFTATGQFSDGSQADQTGQVAWNSSNPGVATIDTAGLATTVLPGTTTIAASLGAVSGSTSFTVTSSPVPLLRGARSYGVTGAADVGIGDLDGRNGPDLAVVSQNTNTVALFLNDGTGVYTGGGTLAVGAGASRILLADLNGTGGLDLAVSNRTDNTVTIYLNDGTGNFPTRTDLTGFLGPTGLAAGDFDGVNGPDLVVSNNTDVSVAIVLNDGAGGFGPLNFFNVGQAPDGVVTGDFDLANGTDVAVAGTLAGSVTVLYNNPIPGLNFLRNDFLAGLTPTDLVVGDLDGVGGPDLIAADTGGAGDSLIVLLNNAGLFVATPVNVGPHQSRLTLLDFNQDNRLDVGLAALNDTRVLLNDGTGAFPALITTNTGPGPSCIASGDLDGASGPDLVGASPATFQASVWLNDGAGGFRDLPAWSTVGNGPFGVAVGQLNGTGSPDVAAVNLGDNTVSILPGMGAGGLGPAAGFAAGPTPSSLALGDVDGQNGLDLIVANADVASTSVSILRNDGTGGYGAPVAVTVGAMPLGAAVADLDGLNGPDLAVAAGTNLVVLLNDGAGGFPAFTNFPTSGQPNSVAVGDFDGVNGPDLVVTLRGNNSVDILLNDGTGAFPTVSTRPVGVFPNSVAVADLDGAGGPDIAVANVASDEFSVLLNDGSGGFAAAAQHAAARGLNSVALADLNCDGLPDLCGLARFSVVVRQNRGGGNFDPPLLYTNQPATFFGLQGDRSIAAADLNGNGLTDLVFPAGLTRIGVLSQP